MAAEEKHFLPFSGDFGDKGRAKNRSFIYLHKTKSERPEIRALKNGSRNQRNKKRNRDI